MLSSSADYKTAIASTDREIRGYVKFSNDFVLRGSGGLVSMKVTQTAMDGERFCVGSTTSASCEIVFYNEGMEGSGVSLANASFDAYVGVVTGNPPDAYTDDLDGVPQVEYKCLGRFYATEITRSTATTRVIGYDIAGNLSIGYVPTVTADPDDGYLVMDILNDIIDQTGVNNGEHFTTFGDSVYVPNIYDGNCRQQWGWLCTIAKTDAAYEFTGSRLPEDLGFMVSHYPGNGEVNPYDMDDSVLYMDGLALGDEFTINSFTTGTKETPIVAGNGLGVVGENPYITQAQADAIETTIHGYKYMPMTLRWRGDPCLDVMDKIRITKANGDVFNTVIMRIVTTFNGGLEQTITAWGDSEAYYELSTSPTDARIATVSNLIKEIAQHIETADGGVITKILDTDGTWKELVIANNQDLDQATSVWRWNINGLAHSTSYTGGLYSFALDDQGRIIANLIQTGILQDALANNYWNLDTGELHISSSNLNSDIEELFSSLSLTQEELTITIGRVENIKTGGRNLLKASNVAYSNTDSPTAVYYFGDSPPIDGEEVTLQIKGFMGEGATSFSVYNSGNTTLEYAFTSESYDTETGIYRATFNWVVGTEDNTFLSVYSLPEDPTRTASIEWIKLERGNQATDWTPAPEDQTEATEAAQAAAEEAASSAEEALETTRKVEATMQFTTDGLKISGTEGSRDDSYVLIGADKQSFVVDNVEVMTLGADGIETQGDITAAGTITGGSLATAHWTITENANSVWSLNYHA